MVKVYLDIHAAGISTIRHTNPCFSKSFGIFLGFVQWLFVMGFLGWLPEWGKPHALQINHGTASDPYKAAEWCNQTPRYPTWNSIGHLSTQDSCTWAYQHLFLDLSDFHRCSETPQNQWFWPLSNPSLIVYSLVSSLDVWFSCCECTVSHSLSGLRNSWSYQWRYCFGYVVCSGSDLCLPGAPWGCGTHNSMSGADIASQSNDISKYWDAVGCWRWRIHLSCCLAFLLPFVS